MISDSSAIKIMDTLYVKRSFFSFDWTRIGRGYIPDHESLSPLSFPYCIFTEKRATYRDSKSYNYSQVVVEDM